jgi:hypothetical protein
MSTDLTRIGQKARKEPNLVFTSLYHHVVDVDNLRACYGTLKPNKATGVDGVTKQQYGKDLVQNLQNLSQRLKDMKYRPQPKRRSYVPKPGSAKGRPLGISSFEDKLVESAVKQVLEPIYYYAITDNSDKCSSYVYHATRILFKWINRKSQRTSYTWKGFQQVLARYKWPRPIIRKDLNPCRRTEAV